MRHRSLAWNHPYLSISFRFESALPNLPGAFRAFQGERVLQGGFWAIPEQTGETWGVAYLQIPTAEAGPPDQFRPWARLSLASGDQDSSWLVGRVMEFGQASRIESELAVSVEVRRSRVQEAGSQIPTAAAAHVVYAYATEFPQVTEFLAAEVGEFEKRHLGHDEAYWELLTELWAREETFVLCEQDVLPYPGAIAELMACSHEYCGKPYKLYVTWMACWGLTKFDANFIKAHPQAIYQAGQMEHPRPQGYGYRHWHTLDSRFAYALLGKDPSDGSGAWPHQHWPAVAHLHDYAREIEAHG